MTWSRDSVRTTVTPPRHFAVSGIVNPHVWPRPPDRERNAIWRGNQARARVAATKRSALISWRPATAAPRPTHRARPRVLRGRRRRPSGARSVFWPGSYSTRRGTQSSRSWMPGRARRRRIAGGSRRSRCRPSPLPPRSGRCGSAAGFTREPEPSRRPPPQRRWRWSFHARGAARCRVFFPGLRIHVWGGSHHVPHT